MRRRQFVDAIGEQRCVWTVTLRDKSQAQCGRAHTDGALCTQHARIRAKMICTYCGSNDENPPTCCVDCQGSKPPVGKNPATPCDYCDDVAPINGE